MFYINLLIAGFIGLAVTETYQAANDALAAFIVGLWLLSVWKVAECWLVPADYEEDEDDYRY